MKKIVFISMFLFLATSLCSAETIYLKSGRAVKGDIVEKTADQITINANGMTLTYYADEIDRIEGASDSPQEAVQAVSPSLSSPQEAGGYVAGRATDYASMSKKDLILKYMEATGVKGSIRRTFADIINASSPDKKEELKKALNLDDVIDALVPVYDQYFTEQDLQELIAFYESPVGRKLLKTLPLIAKDSMDKSISYFKGKLE